MSREFQIDAVSMALNLHEARARLAAVNIANASKPGATVLRADFAAAQDALGQALETADAGAAAHWLDAAARALRVAPTPTESEPIRADEQIAEMSAATLDYQALTETLNRRFGLMRLAVTGRS